ncbi:conserved hypothetical protein [Nitrosococcus halophilus Nc 4]|uniref:Formate dehydrogenase region TAT target n=1 Tax=Nitrosococcus halophilus (strain Nc4) TaxID=472759 RepID=D5C295_NITHN|nr:twin-arginine translocation signal domain-containing protein [Nitrosococcus halophilus]ADE14754.1 conserved hypothetical protein [Nitrosococcus halophilus Nc 4]
MNSKLEVVPKKRRQFLKSLALIAGAAAMATTAKGKLTMMPEEKRAHHESQPKGYHVTPHIQKYYQKARF